MKYIFKTIDMSCEDFQSQEISNEFFLSQFNLPVHEKLKKQTKASYVLLKAMLKDFGIDLDSQKIQTNQYGKPYFVNIPVFFNISHSENLCLVSLSNKPIGCDIQIFSSPNQKIINRYFDRKSKQRMRFCLNKTKAFTKGWTTHESTLKLFSNLRFKNGKVKTDFFQVCDSKKQKYVIAISQNK